jgi:hypothetical protein
MATKQYRTDLNTGLPSNFVIDANGRFGLVGGTDKVQDNISVLLAFSSWYRIYYTDFCVDIAWLLQKPTSMIQTFKTLLLGKFIASAEKYIPYLKVVKMNTIYSVQQRKEFQVSIEYMYNLATSTTLQFTKIVNAIT